MVEMNFEEQGDPTQRKYVLRCKLKFFRKWVAEIVNGKDLGHERKQVMLVPQEGGQQIAFFDAWLPHKVGDYFEVTGFIGSSIDSPTRFAVCRSDAKCEKHYLHVMSTGVADVLRDRDEGSNFQVTINPANSDSEADDSLEAGGDYDLISGHTGPV